MLAAVYPVSKLYYEAVLPSVKSLLIHSDVEKVYLLIEHAKFPNELPDCVETINAKNLKKQFFESKGVNIKKSPYAYLSMLRCAYGKIFEESRILSLDADTIICGDIGSELWDMDMAGNYVAGVMEQKLSRKLRKPYINAGVMMFDLDRIRADGIDYKMIQAINGTDYQWFEQDCINEACAGKIKIIPRIYNSSQFTGVSKKAKIRHFAYEPGWKGYWLFKEYEEIPFSEIRKGDKHGSDNTDPTEAEGKTEVL